MIVNNDQGSFLFALKKPECVAETNVNGFHYFFLNECFSVYNSIFFLLLAQLVQV